MFMKLPKGVTSIHIGDMGALEEVAEGIVDVPSEHITEARRHGLVESDAVIEEDDDHTGKTKAELIAILEEKGVEIPAKATKAMLLDLIAEADKGKE